MQMKMFSLIPINFLFKMNFITMKPGMINMITHNLTKSLKKKMEILYPSFGSTRISKRYLLQFRSLTSAKIYMSLPTQIPTASPSPQIMTMLLSLTRTGTPTTAYQLKTSTSTVTSLPSSTTSL